MASVSCERCGAFLPEEARFCPHCGAPVAFAVTEERKVVTVLFADLARSTELATLLDPERFREVMAAFYQMVSTELAALRGRAEKFIGDAVMAVFGLPQAHEDDALRAVRAGLVIRDRTVRLSDELSLPVPLQVRVGVNSGPVATGSGPPDQLLVSGPAVNLAARLQQAAEPGEVLVGETTWHLTRRSVELGPARRLAAAGFGEVEAWPVVAVSTRSSRRTIPLVDRRYELALLRGVFDRVAESRRPHLVTLLGPTGIGKTRLVEELVAGLPEGVTILQGRVSAFEEDAAFGPVAEMIRRHLGLERRTPHEAVRARLDELVRACCPPSQVEQAAARLGLALGMGDDEPGEGRSYRAAEIRAGFLTLLEGLTVRGPAVLVVDDLHLARPELLEFLEGVLASTRRIPVLAVGAARDSLLEEAPEWGAGLADALRIRLEPLRFGEAKELARVAGDGLDEASAEKIASRAGGNPFFIVETTGMLLQEHPEHATGIPHDHLIPPTVQAVVASRIDHLAPEARMLIRRAAVFPRATFHVSELALIAEPAEEVLRALEEAELLVRDERREGVWRFRHGMLRDVAYESLPKRERLRLHLQVADALAREGATDGRLQSTAYHLERAARASLDLDPRDRSLAERAATALGRAGDRSRRSMESRTAIDLYERALALARPEHGWGREEARILAGLGEARYWLGDFDGAEEALRRALDAGAGDDWAEAHAARFLADVQLNARGDQRAAEELFERALSAARRLGDAWAIARTLLMAGWAPYWRGDLSAARLMFEEALGIARENPEGDRWAEARALTSLASVISPAGDEAECLELSREALALGRDMGDRFTTAVADTYLAASLRRMWRLEEALRHEDGAIEIFRDLGARWELASTLGDRGSVFRFLGRLEEAERDLREAVQICRDIGDRSLIGWTAGELARALLARGDVEAARQASVEPIVGMTEDQASMKAAQALVELRTGDRDLALALALEVLELERKVGHRNYVAARVWWVARLFGDGPAGGPGSVEEARRTLESAHWAQALREPELWGELLVAPDPESAGAAGRARAGGG